MNDFLSIFGAYDFVVRDGLISCLVALAIYVLLSAGIFAIPQVGLMSVGAYISAYFSLHVGTPLVLSILVGGVGSAIVGLGLAALLARLDGIYLAIASIAFSEVVRVAVIELPGLGHAEGLVGLPRGVTDVQICLTVAIAVVALVALRRSRQGLAIAAMSARESGASTSRHSVADPPNQCLRCSKHSRACRSRGGCSVPSGSLVNARARTNSRSCHAARSKLEWPVPSSPELLARRMGVVSDGVGRFRPDVSPATSHDDGGSHEG